MKNLLTITQLGKEEIEDIFNLSLKHNYPSDALRGKNVVFAFAKPSLRTKVGTEAAINHLGGHVIHVQPEVFFEGKILFSGKKEKHIPGRESLKDTVKNKKNGFVFKNYDKESLAKTMLEAIKFYQQKSQFSKMISLLMKEDFSWNKSAKEYLKLYKKII